MTLETRPAPSGRFEWLDFLRGLAAMAVVLFHVRVTLWVGFRDLLSNDAYPSIDRALAWLTVPFPFFGTTVMLFFVVSGFAIHWPYSRCDQPFEPRQYTIRRVLRIYPLYLVAVFLTVLAEQAEQVANSGTPPSSWTTTAASVAMIQNYVGGEQLRANPSLWSLPVEVELYAVYPFVLWFWRRFGMWPMLILVALVSATAAVLLAAGHEWTMGNFLKYWILWVGGAVLAECTRAGTLFEWRARYWVAIAVGVVGAVVSRSIGVHYGFEHFVWGGVYFLLTAWGLQQASPLRRVPRLVRRVALFLGNVSYSLYLVHYPLFVVLGAAWIAVYGSKPSNILIVLALSLTAVPAGYILWRFVEKPSQSKARTLATPRIDAHPVAV